MEVFVEFVCVLSVYGIRVILRGDLTVDKCLNWILRGVSNTYPLSNLPSI